jgi:hypothetical protein
VTDGLWTPKKAMLPDVLAEADRRWTEGDECLHHVMAEFLHRRHPDFSYNVLKRELKAVARKHNRLFGLEGIKKEKK